MFDQQFGPFLIPIVAIVGAFAYGIVKSVMRARVRELEIRERIALIEKGLVPRPEEDPHGFDRAMNAMARPARLDTHRNAGRHRRAGVLMVGTGIGLTLLIGLAGDQSVATALGVGGFIAVLGLAFIVNSVFETKHAESMTTAAVSTRRDPPSQS
jgi:hypothetical protein